MRKYAIYVLLLSVLYLDASLCQIGDHCQLVRVQQSDESDLEYLGIPRTNSWDLEIPDQCMSGSVNWHSPKGFLVLYTYRDNGGYKLCVEESWGFNIGVLKDLTGEEDRELPLPTLSQASCTEDLYGQTKLLIGANSSAMISFDYNINYVY